MIVAESLDRGPPRRLHEAEQSFRRNVLVGKIHSESEVGDVFTGASGCS